MGAWWFARSGVGVVPWANLIAGEWVRVRADMGGWTCGMRGLTVKKACKVWVLLGRVLRVQACETDRPRHVSHTRPTFRARGAWVPRILHAARS